MPCTVRKALCDPSLRTCVTRRIPLVYEEGGSSSADRPPFVESASGLSMLGDFLFVVQDNANWLAIVDGDDRVTALPLPRSPSGVRVFNDDRHNTDQKADLEACVIVEGEDGHELVAFGSGTSESSCWILRVTGIGDEPRSAMHADFIDARDFYGALRKQPDFSGGRVNIEGAIAIGPSRILLLQRGNAALDEGEPVDATAEIEWAPLLAHLRDPSAAPPRRLENVTRYELGELEGVRLTFSDAENLGNGCVLYSASAEDSESGAVRGSVIGLIDPNGEVRWGPILDEQGSPFRSKIEGLSFPPGDRSKIRFVIDDDDETAPSEMFEAVLNGFWERAPAASSAAAT